MSRLEEAIELRNAAQALLSRYGRPEECTYGRRVCFRYGSLNISLRPTLQPWLARPFSLNLANGLDIWCPKKVMNIEWDEKGLVELVSFRRGKWEETLHQLASDTNSPMQVLR